MCQDTTSHEKFMRQALALAQRGQGQVEPNPMVGAVVVRHGQVVAQGYHQAFGEAHAEVAALADCHEKGIDPAGLTMVVTLEPCCHVGKTPPCVQALIDAKLGQVVVAMADPFEQVAGRGIAQLREAGIDVAVGVCEVQARQLNEAFIKRVTTGLPWVTVKWATTLDGKIASRTGDSRWISSEASRQFVHALRGRVDAIMTGIGTVLADAPQLTARNVTVHRVAKRVVVDPHHDLPPGYEQWIVVKDDLEAALRQLADDGATHVLVEAGGGLVGQLLKQGLVDQVLAFVCPKILGDAAGIDPVRGLDLPTIAQTMPLELRQVQRLGEDVLLDYRVPPKGQEP